MAMAYWQEAAKQIREELRRQLPPEVFEDEVAEKKMFGGLAFMVRGKMCICVSGRDEVLVMARIGKKRQNALLPIAGASVTIMRGRPCQGYIALDKNAYENLSFWVSQALGYNLELIKE